MAENAFDYWFKFYPARFRRKTMHLCPYQDGLYRRLIDEYSVKDLPVDASPKQPIGFSAKASGASTPDSKPRPKGSKTRQRRRPSPCRSG